MKKDTENISDNLNWTPQKLLERLPDLALVVDLTNTNRYYNPGNLKKLKTKKKVAESQETSQDKNPNSSNIRNSVQDNANRLDYSRNNSDSMSDIEPYSSSNQSTEIKYVKIYTQGHVVPEVKVVQK